MDKSVPVPRAGLMIVPGLRAEQDTGVDLKEGARDRAVSEPEAGKYPRTCPGIGPDPRPVQGSAGIRIRADARAGSGQCQD